MDKFVPRLEVLSDRVTPTVTAPFPGELFPFHEPVLSDTVEAMEFVGTPTITYADVDRNGHFDLVVTGKGGPRVAVFDGTPPKTLEEDDGVPPLLFNGFLPGFNENPENGPVWADGFEITPVNRVWSIDSDRNGGSDMLFTPSGTAGGPVGTLVRWNGSGFDAVAKLLLDDPNFRGRVFTSADDITGDGNGEVVAWAGSGGAPRLVVYELDQGTLEFSVLYSVYIGPEEDRSGTWRPIPAGFTQVNDVPAVVSNNGDRFNVRVTLLTTGELVTIENGLPAGGF